MKTLTLRTQILLLLGVLQLYFLSLGLVYWVQSNTQLSLKQSFDEDLTIVVKLPHLRADLIDLHMLTNRYLLTGNKSWLIRRNRTLKQIWEIQQELSMVRLDPEERDKIQEMYKQLQGYLADQDHWIDLKRRMQLSLQQATQIITKDSPLEHIIETTVSMRDVNVVQLQEQRTALHRAMNFTFMLALMTGFVASILLTFFVSRFITSPIQELETYLSHWQLGRPWALQTNTASYEVGSLVASIGDMAERLNKQYNQIAELEQMKSQLVAMISHEFNNSLTVVLGILSLLQESEENITERRQHYYETLKSNLRSLSIISTNLLNMGRLESGHFAVNPRKIEVRKILKDSLQRLEILYKRKNIHVFLELPEEVIPVKADPEALSLVVTNLLSNAIKYTPDSGKISIGIIREAGYSDRLQVFVQDTGIGIPEEDQERIFSGYYRTDSSKKAASGFGVGLVLAKLIIEAHHSVLKVESQPGKGSRFYFTLPVWHDIEETSHAEMGPTLYSRP
jgi:signal transduction histidine kinase